jgi:anti-sigma factor RsiW
VNFDDETLMAYADGELDAGLKAQIDAAIEQDPALAQRVEQHRTLRARISVRAHRLQ